MRLEPAVAERVSKLDNALLEAALRYAAEGLPVFPLRAGAKHPPLVSWKSKATTDPAAIRRWWRRWPDANVGIATRGLVVIDFDPKSGGHRELARLDAEHGPFTTRRHLTGLSGRRQGVHLLFRQNGTAVPSRTDVLPGVDVRADGGYIVAPPSLHRSGVRYEVAVDAPIEVVPEALEELACRRRRDGGRQTHEPPSGGLSWAAGALEGARNDSLTRAAGYLARACGSDRAAFDSLVAAVNSTFVPPLPAEEVRRVGDSIWERERSKQFDVDVPDADALAELERQRRRVWANETLRQERQSAEFVEPPSTKTVADDLEIEDGPLTYAVDRLLPAGGNVLLAAQFKTGKTTAAINLLRALADTAPFLGTFDALLAHGRVALWNYEVDGRQIRGWLRKVGVANPDRAALLNARGYRTALTVPAVQEWAVRWLAEREVTFWIVDPFARAFSGSGDENSNTDVGAFVEALDEIKRRAGVSELVLTTHTGRKEHKEGAEHARGATRLDDWADVRWLLTRERHDRFFRATGRDVEVEESKLAFDPLTLELRLDGEGLSREAHRTQSLVESVVLRVRLEPGIGAGDLMRKVQGNHDHVRGAIAEAIRRKRVVVDDSGKKHTHWLPRDAPPRLQEPLL